MPRTPPPPAALTSIDCETLRPVFTPIPDHEIPRQLAPDDPRLIRRTEKRLFLDARRMANALEHIGRLPEPGESFHLVTERRYSMAHVIPATLQLAAPATIEHLTVVTLSFSPANIVDLVAMLDAGQVAAVDFLYSVYSQANEKENAVRLTEELTARGHRIFVGLIHAKILLLALTDGRRLVLEASANLRSCSSLEQMTFTNADDLYDFHRSWVSLLFDKRA